MFGEFLSREIQKARQFEETMAKVRNVYGPEGFDLVMAFGRHQPISYQDAADAIYDCFSAGFDLARAEATLLESLRTSVPVRMLIELYVRMVAAQTALEPIQAIGVDMSTKRQVDKLP